MTAEETENGEREGLRGPVGLHKMIPNLLTLTALAAGLTAIQYAINGRWEHAVGAIVIAALLDALDGATARLMKASSDFGAQLDSLSDFLAFGIAPAFFLYVWVLDDAGKLGWIATIIFASATALRLARFNVMQAEAARRPVWTKGFFAGVPSPAGAGLALLPVFIWFEFPGFFSSFAYASPLVAVWTIFVAALMVSKIPTFSTKRIRFPAKMAMPVLALAAVALAALIHAPWTTLTILAFAYLASLPFSFRRFRELQTKHADEEDLTDLALGAFEIEGSGSGG